MSTSNEPESSDTKGISQDLLDLEQAITSTLDAGTSLSPPTMTANTTFNVGNLSFEVDTENPTVNPPAKVGRLYEKEYRPAVGSKEEKELILSITTNQYEKFTMVNTSVKDIENLKKILSLTQRLKLTKACWEMHDLLDPCNIVFPDPLNPATLELEGGKTKFLDLFDHHRRLSIMDVAASCEFYHKYVQFTLPDSVTKTTVAKELAWSYSHFRNHVEASLYETVNEEFHLFSAEQQGGPLFLKLLLDQLVVSNEASLDDLVHTTTTYDIKSQSTGEDITAVIKLLDAITETIISIRDDTEKPLPERYVQKIIKVFQTTSVEGFNSSFKQLESDLVFNRRFKKTATSTAMMAHGTRKFAPSSSSTAFQLDNDPHSAKFLWKFALETYKDLKENGDWDIGVRPTPGQSTFAITCWNCGDDHIFPECTEPPDEQRIAKNRELFRKNKAESGSPSRPRRKWAWRPPSDSEDDKRIIYGDPFTWDAPSKRWIKDETPESGLTAGAASLPGTVPPVPPIPPHIHNSQCGDDATALTGAISVPAADFAQYQLDLANLIQNSQSWQIT